MHQLHVMLINLAKEYFINFIQPFKTRYQPHRFKSIMLKTVFVMLPNFIQFFFCLFHFEIHKVWMSFEGFNQWVKKWFFIPHLSKKCYPYLWIHPWILIDLNMAFLLLISCLDKSSWIKTISIYFFSLFIEVSSLMMNTIVWSIWETISLSSSPLNAGKAIYSFVRSSSPWTSYQELLGL